MSAGMDMTLAVIAKLRGREKGLEIASLAGYEWHEDASWDPFSADIQWITMRWTWNRILSGLLAVVYIIGSSATGGAEDGFKAFGCVVLPLVCIWFGDAMGGYTGPSGSIWINAPTPGAIVRILGWMLLLLPLVLIIL